MTTALIWSDDDLHYDFGPDHPLKPIRVKLTVSLIRACGMTDAEDVVTLPRASFTTDDVLQMHSEAYVEAVMLASQDPAAPGLFAFGLGPGDNPTFHGMHDASLEVCGASVAAARAVWTGEVAHAFNPAGGLHHAMPDRASGFCVYDDPAAGINWLLANGARRVAYVDVDTHHGDGVQAFYYDDPRVLTISLHESGRFLFPGTGFTDEIGTGDAVGSSLNVPLEPSTTGDIWLSAFDAVVPEALDAFDPDVLVTQLGCDTHATDPLAHLALITNDYMKIATRLHRLAHEHAEGRWVALGGGGYQLATVVPRAWTIYFAELSGADLPHEVPWAWMHEAENSVGVRPPETFNDRPVRLRSERRSMVERAAMQSVEALKRTAFDHLARLA
jgi:acetoin utilization protein AcuC